MLRKQKREEEKKREQDDIMLYAALQEAEKQYEKNKVVQPEDVSVEIDPDATQVIQAKPQKSQKKTAAAFVSPRASEKSKRSQKENKNLKAAYVPSSAKKE